MTTATIDIFEYLTSQKLCKLLELFPSLNDMEKKKFLDCRNEDLRTPLHVALSSKESIVAEFLINNGANVNAKDEAYWTPLHIACSIGLESLVDLLLRKGANPNAQNEAGCTPLHYTASKDHIECAKMLISFGARISEKDEKKQTPLHRACIKGNVKFVKLLFSYNINDIKDILNSKDISGNTPLHYACEGNAAELALFLIETGAQTAIENKESQKPLDLCAKTVQRYLENNRSAY